MVKIVDFVDNYKEKLFEIQDKVLLPNDKMTKEQFFDEFTRDTRKYFVALYDENLVGFIGLYNYDDDMNIIQLAVDAPFQNNGIGSQLINKAKDFAKSLGKKSLSLEVDSNNTNAQNFYKKHNFVTISTRKNYYKTSDAFVMFCFF